MNLRETISNNLRRHRRDSNLTQEEVAVMLNIKHRTYQAYEEARCEPSIETLIRLCSVYKLATIDQLIFDLGKIPESDMSTAESFHKKYLKAGKDRRGIVDFILSMDR